MKNTIGIVGPGRLGRSLARAFIAKGAVVAGVSGLDEEETARASKELGVAAFADKKQLAAVSDIIFLTVPDRMIIAVAEELIAAGLRPGTRLFHCSGAMPAGVLPVAAGVLRGSFHPLQSFADGIKEFAGVYIAVDGEASETGYAMCDFLGGISMSVPPGDRALYHTAACIASNHLVTVLSWAEGLMSRWAGTPAAGLVALMPLIEGSLANMKKLGAEKALTGPVARGDTDTVARHLAALPQELREQYRMMSLYTLDLAVKAESITPQAACDMGKILKRGATDGKGYDSDNP